MTSKLKRAGFASKDLIITFVVMGIIWALAATYLFSANAARNAAEEKNDLSTTFTTMYEKAKANNSEEDYNLSKIFNGNTVYDINKKTYLKTINGKKVSSAASGFATYTGSTSLANTTWITSPGDNEIGVILGTSYSLVNAACDWISGTDNILSITDSKSVINKTKDSVCRGAADWDENKHVIYVVKDNSTAEKMNQKLFDNDWEVITVGSASWVVLKL